MVYNLAHNFGYGQQYLAATFAALNPLAFAFHTVLDCRETLWQPTYQAIGAHRAFFAHLHTIAAYGSFPSRMALFLAMASGKAPSFKENFCQREARLDKAQSHLILWRTVAIHKLYSHRAIDRE